MHDTPTMLIALDSKVVRKIKQRCRPNGRIHWGNEKLREMRVDRRRKAVRMVQTAVPLIQY